MHSGSTNSKNQHIVLGGLALFVLTQAYLAFYQYWIGFFATGTLIVLYLTWITVVDPIFSKNFLLYLITPLLFFFAIISFVTLTEVTVFQHIASIALGVVSWLYFHTLYLFNYNFEKYNENGIENVSSYINLITFYLSAIVLYAGSTLIGVPFYILGIVLTLILLGIGYQSLWAAGMELIKTYVYLIILSIIILEVFWTVAFLPTNFYVSGFLVAVAYYTAWGLFKSHIHSVLTGKVLARYLAVALIAIITVVITSVWI